MCASLLVLLGTALTANAQTSSSSGTRSGSTGSSYPSNGSTGSSSSSTSDRGSYGSGMNSSTDSSMNSSMNSSSTTMSSNKLGWGDRRFVTKAADGGQSEVDLAQLAAERASNPDVRAFAQKLVSDHSKVNSELENLASTKSVKLDQDNDKDRAYKRLSAKSGPDFDREFIDHMIDEHEDDIKMFEKASVDAKDLDVRNFASKHLADLRQHLQQAQALQRSTMPTGRTDEDNNASSSSSSSSTPSSRSSSNSAAGSTSSGSSDSMNSGTNSSSSTTPRR
jgi:putative membrane protein